MIPRSTLLRLMLVVDVSFVLLAPACATDALHITEAEKAACTQDAERLCASAYPDEQKLLACMKANRASLGPTCLPVFDAGLKRRGL